jgi:O-acetyl-ADP-ribose deacetylase (regulator of RNase III)
MTFKYQSGSIFNSNCSTLIDAVNCLGVKGAGLALQFRERYSQSYLEYRGVCSKGLLKPGDILLSQDQGVSIVHFATKGDWRNPSQLEWVESGLVNLVNLIHSEEITSIAIPKLGCGLGGLEWSDVRPLILNAVSKCPQCHFEIYGEAPASTLARRVPIPIRRK